ncbi:MAG: hypothetical protein ACREKF_12705 [Candidatus Methylomirabilales bacterium]
MAKRLVELVRSVDTVLDERKRLAQREKRLVRALNRALGKLGYAVIAAKGGGGRRRRRRGRRPGRKPKAA